jgi:PAP2 superfamily
MGSTEGVHSRALTRRELVTRAGAAAAVLAAGPLVARAGASHSSPPARELDAKVATDWADLERRLIMRTPGYSPPVASRALAYSGVTLYEAIEPGLSRGRSLAGVLPGLGEASAARKAAHHWALVANAGLAEILRLLFPTAPSDVRSELDALEAAFVERYRRRTSRAVLDRSAARGREVAAHIFEWSRSDGGHEGYTRNFPPYTPPSGTGLWVPTPPAFQSALQPTWGSNRCFAIAAGTVCSPGEHPPYSEAPGSAFHAEGFEVFDTVNRLTPEQETVARFWSDDPGATATPAGHSWALATIALRREDASLATAAETYAKLGIALADAFIACWHQKFAFNLLRPVTYARQVFDSSWTPVLVTPPFPEYPSGHSVQSGAMAAVLTDLFGRRYRFVDDTHESRGFEPRRFRSFDEAAEEAALSRLYGGIHFRAAIVNGIEQGRCIGAAANALPIGERRRGGGDDDDDD